MSIALEEEMVLEEPKTREDRPDCVLPEVAADCIVSAGGDAREAFGAFRRMFQALPKDSVRWGFLMAIADLPQGRFDSLHRLCADADPEAVGYASAAMLFGLLTLAPEQREAFARSLQLIALTPSGSHALHHAERTLRRVRRRLRVRAVQGASA